MSDGKEPEDERVYMMVRENVPGWLPNGVQSQGGWRGILRGLSYSSMFMCRASCGGTLSSESNMKYQFFGRTYLRLDVLGDDLILSWCSFGKKCGRMRFRLEAELVEPLLRVVLGHVSKAVTLAGPSLRDVEARTHAAWLQNSLSSSVRGFLYTYKKESTFEERDCLEEWSGMPLEDWFEEEE